MFTDRLKHHFKRFRHTGLSAVWMIRLGIRLYAGAVLSTGFNFRLVHAYVDRDYDHGNIPIRNESLRLLKYIDEPFNANEKFSSSIGKEVQALKEKEGHIAPSDTLHEVLVRGSLGILDIKSTDKLPPHLQKAENIIALAHVFPWMHIERKYYVELETVKSFVYFDSPPMEVIDAASIPMEIVEYILIHAKKPSAWLDVKSLSEDQKVELLRKDKTIQNNPYAFMPTIKKGLVKYPMDYVGRLSHMHQPAILELVDWCNKNSIRFDLGRTTEESRGILNMLHNGLEPALVSEDELNTFKLENFSVDSVNLDAMTSAKNTDQWSRHIQSMVKSFSADDWLDLEQFVDRYPKKLHLVNPENQTVSMVITRFSQRKIQNFYFSLVHKGCLDAIPILVREKPELIPIIISKNDDKERLSNAFFSEIQKMPELPEFVTQLSMPELLNKACDQSCLYSRAQLVKFNIAEVLATANTRTQFEFIDRYLAPNSVERHVDLYPESMHDELLMSDLGL